MKRFSILAVLFLTATAWAQFTTVSGTVTDPNGLPYANGTISALLVTSASPTLNGLAYTPPTQPVGLNAAGFFVMQLADNTQLLPAATKWTFTVCSGAGTVQPAGGKGPICFSLAAPITISGTSQDISVQLSAVAQALSVIPFGPILVPNGTTGNNTTSTNAIQGTDPGTGITFDTATHSVCFNSSTHGGQVCVNVGTGLIINSGNNVAWASSLNVLGATDTYLSRAGAAGVLQLGALPNQSTGKLKASGYMSVGTKFTTNNGCTDSATAGGATAGTFTVGSTSCTEIVTMGDSATAPNGWSCTVVDITTLADVTNPHQTTSNATTATFVTGTVVSGDKIQFSCIGY